MPELLRVDEGIARKQCERLASLRSRRDSQALQQALDRLENAAQSRDNLMPYILSAVEAYATTGEICTTLRRVWGEYQASMTI